MWIGNVTSLGVLQKEKKKKGKRQGRKEGTRRKKSLYLLKTDYGKE